MDEQFNNLNDEIKAINRKYAGDTVRSVKDSLNLETLYLKVNQNVELKLVLQKDYPKISPNSLQIVYNKAENSNYQEQEALEMFFRTLNLTLNDIIDRSYGKCCVFTIYKTMMQIISENKPSLRVEPLNIKLIVNEERPQLRALEDKSTGVSLELERLCVSPEIEQPTVDTRDLKCEIKDWSYQAALAIIPPQNASKTVQKIREKYDRTFDRWPPHINLLYPFCENINVEQVTADLAKVLAKHKPFNLSLNKLNHFANNSVVYLETSARDISTLKKLQSDLAEYFGQAPNKANAEFKSHMTIAQPEDRKSAEKNWSLKMMKKITDEFSRDGIAAEFPVDAVYYITRNGANDPFRIKHAFPLGPNADSAAKSNSSQYAMFNYF